MTNRAGTRFHGAKSRSWTLPLVKENRADATMRSPVF
jgi:hypothetical protein